MADNFDPAAPKTPSAVNQLQITLYVNDVGGSNEYQATYKFPVFDGDGNVVETRSGPLIPHMTAGQITAAQSFMDTMFTKAKSVIPS